MEKYCGNARPFLYVLFGEQDKAEAEKIMGALAENGHSLWYADGFTKQEEKRLKKAAALVVVLSPAFAGSGDLKKAVGLASKVNMPILSVYLEATRLSPGLSMLLGTTQGVFRPNFDSDEEMLHKLCAAPILQSLSVTPGQKAAAKKTTALIAVASIAAVVAAVLTVLGVFREVVPIDPNSDLARLGVSGNALDIEEFYLYGGTVQKKYALSQLVGQANGPTVLYLEGEDTPIPLGQLTTVQDFAQLTNLEKLCLAGNPISDVSPLANLTELRLLDLSGGESMHETDLSPLAGLPNLETLNLAFTWAGDFASLRACPALKTLYLSYAEEAEYNREPLSGVEVIFVDGKAEDFATLKEASEKEDIRSIFIARPITIPEGQTVTIRNGVSMYIDELAGQFTNHGELVINGKFQVNQTSFLNTGTLRIGNNAQVHLSGGEFDNRGSLFVDGVGYFNTTEENICYQTGILENNGDMSVSFGSQLHLDGGTFTQNWGFLAHDQGELHVNGGTLENNGGLNFAPDGYLLGDFRSITGSGEINCEMVSDDTLNQFGISGNAMDYTSFYLYGDTVRDYYSLSQITWSAVPKDSRWEDQVILQDTGERLGWGQLSDFSGFSQLLNLEELCLACNRITDLSFLKNMPYLRVLDLSGNRQIQTTDLTPLTKLPRLEVLNLALCEVKDFSPLRKCPSLKTLYLSYADEWAINPTSLPGVEIIFLDTKAESMDELRAAMEDESVYSVVMTAPIQIRSGETLTIREGTSILAHNLVNRGELILNGTIQIHGRECQNKGTIRCNPYGMLMVCDAHLDNRGDIYIEDGGVLTVNVSGILLQNAGHLQNNHYIEMWDNGELQYNGGILENNGVISMWNNGHIAGKKKADPAPGRFEYLPW